jgi:hypothetical protein
VALVEDFPAHCRQPKRTNSVPIHPVRESLPSGTVSLMAAGQLNTHSEQGEKMKNGNWARRLLAMKLVHGIMDNEDDHRIILENGEIQVDREKPMATVKGLPPPDAVRVAIEVEASFSRMGISNSCVGIIATH